MKLELSQEHIAREAEGHPGHRVCVVCENIVSELFAVAKCTHTFCKECSISYIAVQSNNFSQACCLQDGCRAPLNKSLPIYQLLDQPTLHKLQQF